MITLWGRRSSSNVIKVLWTLAELGLEFERKTVGGQFGGNREAAYLAMNPMGLVPVLQDGAAAMFESNAIVRYLGARYGAGGFRPEYPAGLAAAEQWMEWQQHFFVPPVSALFMQLVRTPADKRNAAAIAEAEARLEQAVEIAGKRLEDAPFFAGERLTMADIPMGVLLWRLSQLECRQPEHPAVARWFAMLKERKAYRDWVMVPVGASPQEWTANEKLLG